MPVAVAATAGHPVDPALGEQPGAVGQRPRHVGEQHRALGSGRAAERAVVAAGAVDLVARVRDDLPSHRVGALLEEGRVAADRLRILVGHVQDALDLLEVRPHRLGRDVGQRGVAGPPVEDSLGRTEGHAPVDHCGAADAASLGEQDGRAADGRLGAAVAIEGPEGVADAGAIRLRGVVAALLHDDDVHAGRGEFGGHGGAAGAGSDDDDVADDPQIAVDGVAGDDPLGDRAGGGCRRHGHRPPCSAARISGPWSASRRAFTSAM